MATGWRAHIEKVRQATDLTELVQQRTGPLHGKMALCPFHDDTAPSLSLDPVRGRFHCFGCGVAGDVFTFAQLAVGVPFREAVDLLAEKAGIEKFQGSPEETKRIEAERAVGDVLTETAAYYRQRLSSEARTYLTEERGLPAEICDRFQVGWADGYLHQHLLERRGHPLDLCRRAGVLIGETATSVRDVFRHRVMFPTFRHGRVINLSGRGLRGEEPKYLHLKGRRRSLFNAEAALRQKTVYVVEGVLDALSLEAWGLPAAALLGASGLKPEQAKWFARAETVYVCLDGDRAGEDGAVQLGELLGSKARIVHLPEGQDPNDLFKSDQRELFDRLVREAADPITDAITRIPADIPKVDLATRLEPIVRRLAASDPATAEAHLSRTLKDRFELKAPEVKAYRDILRQARRDLAVAPRTDDSRAEATLIWQDHRLVNPAQDFVDGVAYFSIYLTRKIESSEGRTKTVPAPHLVTSKRELFALTPEELASRGLRRVREDQVPTDTARWATAPDIPNSVHAFLQGTAAVDPLGLFCQIEELFRTYLDYTNPLYYPFMALWCMGSYVFMLFESFPYVFLSGTKRTGKTRTIEVAAPLCFNSVMSASISDAAMFRTTESDRGTVFHDEAARYHGRQRGDVSERLEIFNSGYKRSGAVLRCVGDNNVPTRFSTYSPKLLANVEGLDSTAADRTITLNLLRTRGELPRFSTRRLEATFTALRHSLYVFALTHHAEIAAIYESDQRVDNLRDREEELWGPILALAEFFDRRAAATAVAGAEEADLARRMIRLALSSRDRKREAEMDENPEQKILAGVLGFLPGAKEVRASDQQGTCFYLADHLLKYLKEIDGLDWLSKNYLTRTLNKLQVLRPEEKDKEYLWVHLEHMTIDRGAKQVLCYRLDRDRVREVAERYGVALDGPWGVSSEEAEEGGGDGAE